MHIVNTIRWVEEGGGAFVDLSVLKTLLSTKNFKGTVDEISSEPPFT